MMLHRIPERLIDMMPAETPLVLCLSKAASLEFRLGADFDRRVAWIECAEMPENCEALPDPPEECPPPGIDYHVTVDAFGSVYQLAQLAGRYPVRVCLPALPEAQRALRLAAALGIEAQIKAGQPDGDSIAFLEGALFEYLHGHDVAAPVEFFHSLLAAYCRNEPANLWEIQGESPLSIVDVPDAGIERLPGRLAALRPPDFDAFRRDFPRLADSHPECRACSHAPACRGFFKWPDHGYSCSALRERVLDPLKSAAQQLAAMLREPLEPAAAPPP